MRIKSTMFKTRLMPPERKMSPGAGFPEPLFPNGSPFGDPGPHGDLFGDLGPHFMFWVPFFLYFRLKNAKE